MNARTILSQPSESSLKQGQLDVGAFVSSRKYEIQQLSASMRKSKAIQKQQTFQVVPRSLRRRAASHHVRFLPPRFREQAQQEYKDSGIQLKPKKRRRITRLHLRRDTALKLKYFARQRKAYHCNRKRSTYPVGINELATKVIMERKFKRRQKDKTWLPTHLWHAKRAHMIKKWGYVIPSHPNEKCFRRTHRASQNGSGIVFDTSYYATMILQGNHDSVLNIVNIISRGKACGKTYLLGDRAFEGPVYNVYRSTAGEGSVESAFGEAVIYFEPTTDLEGSLANKSRRALIRVHPAAFDDTWKMLMSLVKTTREQELNSDPDIELQDCRFSIGSIDIFGPKSLTVIGHNLRLNVEKDVTVLGAWSMATLEGDPKLIPLGAVFPLKFFDPRTISTPSRDRKLFDSEHRGALNHTMVCKGLNDFARNLGSRTPSPLLTTEGRSIRVEHAKIAHGRLKQRRAANSKAVDATKGNQIRLKLESLVFNDDVSIPAVMIRRASGGISLLLPWQWVAIFFKKLVLPAYTMCGGLQQYHQILSERMLPYFPDDYPGTSAGQVEEREKMTQREKEWKSRPRSKKVIYDALDLRNGEKKGEVGNPFACDWSYLLHADARGEHDPSKELSDLNEPWMITNLAGILSERNKLRKELNLLTAVFTVQIIMIGRGAPRPGARIYAIPVRDRSKWMKLKWNRKVVPESSEYPVCPKSAFLIGFITSGGFNLKEGKGSGIASLSWAKVEQNGGFNYRYCVVRDVGESIGRLALYKPL
ncbi:ribonucleases P/MRP protein subunit POP1-domain-containing protein [Lipomyces kononenkoae]|uniref:Ribonucleases P/MRP protein subunit POP1-domain-containing protein n=1 Tax=Lipomyces kononenkoae TaxID=34357 RepID=A0ACC3T7F1_LIPKO